MDAVVLPAPGKGGGGRRKLQGGESCLVCAIFQVQNLIYWTQENNFRRASPSRATTLKTGHINDNLNVTISQNNIKTAAARGILRTNGFVN